MTPVRIPLPQRRPSVTRVVTIADRLVAVTVGFHLDGRPGEVFADGPKEGSQMQAVLSDACVLISIALQHGLSPAALAQLMRRSPAPWLGENATVWASPIGAILEVVRAGLGDDPDPTLAPAAPLPGSGPVGADVAVRLPDPAIWARFVEALPPILLREWKLAALHEAAGGISWDGRSGWRALTSSDLLRLMDVAEAAGVWAPPVPDPSGDDPLRARPARNTAG